MPQLSTHLHFTKLLAENTDDDVHLCSFLLGIVSPDTFPDKESYYDYHFLEENDEDGDDDIDVREFYERFNFKKMDKLTKSFVIGYYAHLWLDEYFKFNSSKLTLNNEFDLSDKQLSKSVKELMRLFDEEITNNYFDGIMKEIEGFNLDLKHKALKHVDIEKSKKLLFETYNEKKPSDVHEELLDRDEYKKLMKKSVKRFFKSL
jgi:hypothetical protein